MKVALLATLFVALTFAMTCSSPYPRLVKACEEVSKEVEALWGKVDAFVTVTYGSAYETVGSPGAKSFVVKLKDLNLCALAHELTHVVELYRGVSGPDWFVEGLAELSCYLLYPNLYNKGYEEWVERGYGYYNPYFFGLTVLYYAYERGYDVWSLKNLSFVDASKLFAEALQRGPLPFGVEPSPPPFGQVTFEKPGWAFTADSVGDVRVYGKVSVFYGPGVAKFPFSALPSLFLLGKRKRCGSRASTRERGATR